MLDVLKQVLGQATSGVREGAGRLDEATGASGRARDAIGQATGQSPDELIAKLKDLIANNKLGAGAALGGLGALILGTGAGRALAGSAARLGGLALIGGLAYKAYQNYQQGLPPLGGAKPPSQQGLVAAPNGSGFEPEAVTHESAMLYVRAMIAAAAADGRIDANERQKILGGLQQAGMNEAAQQFLTSEINNPATVEDLAAAVSSPQDAVQIYTAARIAIDVDSNAEHEFLQRLAERARHRRRPRCSGRRRSAGDGSLRRRIVAPEMNELRGCSHGAAGPSLGQTRSSVMRIMHPISLVFQGFARHLTLECARPPCDRVRHPSSFRTPMIESHILWPCPTQNS